MPAWSAGEIRGRAYLRIGFDVTNLDRGAEPVVAFHNQRRTAERHVKEGKNAIKRTCLSRLRRPQQRRPAPASCAHLQTRQLHADAGVAKGRGTLVADHPEEETDQDRRKDRQPRPLRHIPDARDAVSRALFEDILRLIDGLPGKASPA